MLDRICIYIEYFILKDIYHVKNQIKGGLLGAVQAKTIHELNST